MAVPVKQNILKILRDCRILSLAEKANFFKEILQNYVKNIMVARSYPDFSFPPFGSMYDAYGTVSYQGYMEWGLEGARILGTYVNPLFDNDREKLKILDWGCGPARIVRFLDKFLGGHQAEIWGSDYNNQTIEYCKKHIKNCHFIINNLEPPLPFEDGYFDFLYSLSVYTHLPEDLGVLWFRENLRVVRKGGYILLTVHGDKFAGKLLPEELEKYQNYGFVERAMVLKGSRLFVSFHSPYYMRNILLKNQKIILHDPLSPQYIANNQDLWIVQKQ